MIGTVMIACAGWFSPCYAGSPPPPPPIVEAPAPAEEKKWTPAPTTTTTVPVRTVRAPVKRPAPAPVATTTTTMAPSAPAAPDILTTAKADIDRPMTDWTSKGFWCAVWVEDLLVRHGFAQTDPWGPQNVRPSWLHQTLPAVTDPQPGDVVFFSFQPGTGQPDHVAIVASLNPLVVIDGNGGDRNAVAQWEPTGMHLVSYARY